MPPTIRSKTASRRKPAGNAPWAEQTLRKMSLREKIGQLLMVDFFGVFTSAQSPAYARLIDLVDNLHVGGFIAAALRTPLGIERSQVCPTAILLNALQSRSKIPLLIGADFETGTSMRLKEGTSLPMPWPLPPRAILSPPAPPEKYAPRSARRWSALDFRARCRRQRQPR